MKVNWWIHPNHIFLQGAKRRAGKRLQQRCFPVNFLKFLVKPFFKNTYGGCFWRWTQRNQTTAHDISIEQLLSLNDSLWIILAARRNGHVTFFIAGQKLKWGKTKWIISFLYFFKKSNFYVEGSAIAPSVHPQLRHWYFADLYSYHILTTLIIQNIN